MVIFPRRRTGLGAGGSADGKPPRAHAVPVTRQTLTDSARGPPRPAESLGPRLPRLPPPSPSLGRTWPGGVARRCRPAQVRGLAARADGAVSARGHPPSCHARRPPPAGSARSHLAVRAHGGLVEGSLQLNLIGSFSAAHKSVCSAEAPGRPARSHC